MRTVLIENIEVEVYKPLDDISLNIYSPAENANVAKVTKQLTSLNNSTLVSAVIAVGAGIPLQMAKYPSDANTVSTVYTSSNLMVATVSTSGYIVAKSLGTTTITVKVGHNIDIGDGESQVDYIERIIALTVYMPIISTQLNYHQSELYDSNTLSYYELSKGQLQLDLNINPVNASFNKSSIAWTTNSNYATVDQNGLVKVYLPAEINFATVTITATIVEYNRYYSQKCVISVKKPIKVTGVSVLNIEDHLYFDARKGLGIDSAAQSSFKISAQAYPINASNTALVYKYVQNADDSLEEAVVKVESDGTVIPLRSGEAKIYVIAQDSYTSSTEFTKYTIINVRVADGLSDDTAIEISSAQELFNINTVDGLTLHYVLSQTIDLTGVNITSIGSIDSVVIGFSGVINGHFSYFDYDIENQIIGASFNISNIDRNNNIGLFASLVNGGTIKNLTYKVNVFTMNLSNNSSGTSSNIGALVARNENGTIENVKVQLLNSDIELSNRINYVGGIVGYNSGQISSSQIYGKLNVSKRISITTEPLIYVGGMVGYNTGSISGDFDVADDTLLENYSSFNSRIQISCTAMQNSLDTFGGIVGYNTGSVQNITTNANVSGLNNVGGAIGYNTATGEVNKVLSAGLVKGTLNVGGLIGYSSGSVSNIVVLILDQFDLLDIVTPQIQGVNYVGGLVGYSANTTIDYSYVKSFYTRTIDDLLYFGDLVINIPQSYASSVYAGGLVGYAETVGLNAVYSHLNMKINDDYLTGVNVFAGGILGANSIIASIENAYAKGSLIADSNAYLGGIAGQISSAGSLINKTYTMLNMTGANVEGIVANALGASNFTNSFYLNSIAVAGTYGTATSLEDMQIIATYTGVSFGFISLGGSPFELDANYNDSTPFILYDDGITKMLIQAPTALDITVYDGITSVDEVKNNHFKLSDKRAVVYYYPDGAYSVNTYSLDNTSHDYGEPIVAKSFTPSTVNVNLVGFISSDTTIARVTTDGLLEVYKTGIVKITIYSILDKKCL